MTKNKILTFIKDINMRDLQKEKLYKRKNAPNCYSSDLRLLSQTFTHIFFPHFYKRKSSFILGAARVRKKKPKWCLYPCVPKKHLCFCWYSFRYGDVSPIDSLPPSTLIPVTQQTTSRGCRLRPLRCLSQFKSISWKVSVISKAQRVYIIPGVMVVFIGW
jgi:hypothetical protein